MSGIDWQGLGRETFEEIVDILLGREFGTRGHAVNGRGGDDGIDYNVDSTKIIFQYKWFPDGFPASGSRRDQIRKSFKKALQHDPDQWVLVVPATLTPNERLFVTGLGKGKRVQISIRDRVWLNNTLIENRDVAEHYRFSSDVDYLFGKGERFTNNPVVRDTDDVTDRIRGLQDAIDTADPNWAIDFHSVDGQITQVLRAKDPEAPDRSPITIQVTAELESGSPQARDLQQAEAFGYTKPIVLPGEMIKNFSVTGPRILGRDQNQDRVDRLEFHPVIENFGAWTPTELVLADAAGEQLGIYLAEGRLLGAGREGATLRVRLGRHLEMTFRLPTEAVASDTDFSPEDLSDAPVAEVFETADFIVQLAAAATLEIRAQRDRIALLDVAGQMVETQLADGFAEIRDTAEDLKIIEANTRAKFRYPATMAVVDRIMIRNLRLMLEGHCVAHPLNTRVTAQLNGVWDDSLEQILTTDYYWAMTTQQPGELTILDQPVRLPHLGRAAMVHLDQDEIDAIRAAFREGTAAGRSIQFTVRPGDRIRMFLPDRVGENKHPEITPWDLPGVHQRGLDPNGQPLDPDHPDE